MVVSINFWKNTGLNGLVLRVSIFYVLAIIATSCGGGGHQQVDISADQIQTTDSGGGSFPAPPPSSLKELSYLQPDLDNRGNEFVNASGYPQGRVVENAGRAIFSPDWGHDRRLSSNLAFATYAFNIPGYDLEQSITFSFAQTGEFAEAWVGIANYSEDKWNWFPMPEDLTLAVDFEAYLHPVTETLLVLPVFMGTQEWILERIRVGPDFGPGEIRALDGYVYEIDGTSPKNNVEMSISGDYEFSAVTSLGGHWVEYFVPEGNYTVTPYLYSRRFFPSHRDITVFGADMTVEPFLDGNVPLYQASGLVLWPNGITPMPFIDIEIQGDDRGFTFTNSDGIWVADLPNGDYSVRPVSESWGFDPAFMEFTIADDAVELGTFIAQELEPQRIEGFVYQDNEETPLKDAQVFIDGEHSYQKTSDTHGLWRVWEIYQGDYRVTPVMDGMTFDPPYIDVTVEDEFLVLEPFIASLATKPTLNGSVVQDVNGDPVADVLVTASNRFYSYEATTGLDGTWSISDVNPGDYSVKATGETWKIAPDEFTITVDDFNLTISPFTATLRNPFAVYGYILDEDGISPLGGIQVGLSGDGVYLALSGMDGFWIIPDVLEGNYLVEPFLAGRSFDPESRVITVSEDSYRVDDFSLAYHPRHSVSGFVWTDTWPTPLPGVRVYVANLFFGYETTTDSEGNFQIDDVLDSDYYIWCDYYGYRFEPPWYNETIDGEDFVVEPFEAIELPSFTVDGFTFEDDGFTPIKNVTVTLDGLYNFTGVSGTDGHWVMFGVFDGDYEASAELLGWDFNPVVSDISISGMDTTLDDFLGTELDWYTLDGNVFEADGTTPIAGVRVVAMGENTRIADTDAAGYFEISILNGEYSVSAQKSGYTFTPLSQPALINNSDLTIDSFFDMGE